MFTRARIMQRGCLSKRAPYKHDVRYPKFEFYELHPIHNRICVDVQRVVSLSVNWPLESGIEERENTIVIESSHADYTKLRTVPECKFPVYVWDSVARVGYARGEFTISASNPTKFVLKRITRAPDAATVADEVMQKVNTNFAIAQALAPGFEEQAIQARPRPAREIQEPKAQDRPRPAREIQEPEPKRRAVEEEYECKRISGLDIRLKKYNGFSRPTEYNGVEYRSLTEARFAISLDTLAIPFSYETMSFKRPGGGRYTPDFFLPNQQLLIELKPAHPLVNEEQKCEELSQCGFRIVCMYGERIGMLPFAYQIGRKRDYSHKEGVRGIAWHNGEKLAGEVAFVVGKNPKPTPSPLEMLGDNDVAHLDVVCSSRDVRWNVPVIQSALETAGAIISE